MALSKKAFRIALVVATIASLSQLFTGHRSAEGVSKNQPAKLAAMEGHFSEKGAADMYLFGWVDKEQQKVWGLKLPGGLSFLLHQNFSEPVTGLGAFPKDERPTAINAIFQFYHLMIAIGMFLIGLTVFACVLWWKGRLFEHRWLLKVFVAAVFLPQIANQVGWFAAEMGRQPWVVYGLLRTSDALSKVVTANQVMFSIVLFTIVYVFLFALFVYMMNKKIQRGPDESTLGEQRPMQQGMAQIFKPTD